MSLAFKDSRQGFTLVELLVVIGIIGILISMLLPAIQVVRSAARTTACSNNLKQVVIATLNYESSFQQFPPGYLGPDPNDTGLSIRKGGRQQFTGGLVFIFAHMEQANIRSLVPDEYLSLARLGEPAWWVNDDLRALAEAKVPSLVCPEVDEQPLNVIVSTHVSLDENLEDPEERPVFDGLAVNPEGRLIQNFEFGLTSYRPCGGEVGLIPGRRGILRNRSETTLSEITDGASNTILFGEASPGDTEYGWIAGGTIESVFGFGETTHRWGSLHPGGVVNFCFADGSVHSFNDSLDLSILATYSSMEDGQVNEEF